MKQPGEILVIKPSSLGDVVHTLPAIAMIKRHWPATHLRWLINSEWAPLLAGNPHVDVAVHFPRREFQGLRGWIKIPRWARRMAGQKADLVLDFQGLLRSALIARLCRRGEVVGLADAREGARWWYDRAVSVANSRHAVDRYLALVAALGIPTDVPLEWPLPAGEPPAGIDPQQPFILLHPFARGPGKSLSRGQIEEFCRGLPGHSIVLAGRTGVAGSAPAVPPSGSEGALARLVDLLDRTTLLELIWLIRHAAYVVSVDSGPMHIAAALNPRLVAIHTWSDPAKVGPYRPEAWVWKDRALFQMRDLNHPSTHTACADVAALARFVHQQLHQ